MYTSLIASIVNMNIILYVIIIHIYPKKGITMRRTLLITTALVLCTGCSATWNGFKEDTKNATAWTKTKVNQGATSVKEKTE